MIEILAFVLAEIEITQKNSGYSVTKVNQQ